MYLCKRCFEIKYRKNVTLQSKSKPIIIKEDKKLPPNIGNNHVGSKLYCLGCREMLPVSDFEDSTSGKELYCKKCSNKANIQPINAASFTINDGFTISKNSIVNKEPIPKQIEQTSIEEVISDATLEKLVGSLIKTGVAIVKHIMKDLK